MVSLGVQSTHKQNGVNQEHLQDHAWFAVKSFEIAMTPLTTQVENSPLVLHLHPVINLTDDQFFEFCQINRDLRIERTATGELLIMPPTGTETGGRNFNLIGHYGLGLIKMGLALALTLVQA